MATPGSSRFVVGSRVDCLFDDNYFRGTVDIVKNGGRFRVYFDDGDVREDVPCEEIMHPLEVASRVECLFEVYCNSASSSFSARETFRKAHAEASWHSSMCLQKVVQ